MRTKTAQIQKQSGLGTIVVALGPTDLDRIDRLTEEAIDIAEPAGATVVLVHVFAPDSYGDTLESLGFDVATPEASPDEVAARHSAVRTAARRFDEAGVDYEIRGALGERGEKIISLAEDVDADMIIVGGRVRSPTGKAVFGSTAQEVMLAAPCPVTFVRADTR